MAKLQVQRCHRDCASTFDTVKTHWIGCNVLLWEVIVAVSGWRACGLCKACSCTQLWL